MALFGLLGGTPKRITTPVDPQWVKNKSGGFHQLMKLDTAEAGLSGVGGVYVIWHGGVKPGWVYIGETDDLSLALDDAADNPDINQYEINGKLSVTWSRIRKEMRPGVVLYLTKGLKPRIDNPDAPKEETNRILAVPVKLPGAKAG